MSKIEGDFINGSNILRSNHSFFFNVAEQRDFRLKVFREEAIGTAKKNVGLDSNAEQLFH